MLWVVEVEVEVLALQQAVLGDRAFLFCVT
jgi:hypothetical protein